MCCFHAEVGGNEVKQEEHEHKLMAIDNCNVNGLEWFIQFYVKDLFSVFSNQLCL